MTTPEPRSRGVGQLLDADELSFEQMRQFFVLHVWLPNDMEWDAWLSRIQIRRNAIHAYRPRDVGTHDEFLAALAETAVSRT